jgi:hypothetical protein
MRVGYRRGGNGAPEGFIVYDERRRRVSFETGENDLGIRRLRDYLTRRQSFRIPESQVIDDYRIERAKPTDNRTFFELALCRAYAATEFWILWDTQEG